MEKLTTMVDGYLSAWNETDPARRADLVAKVWGDDGRLIDPPTAAGGSVGLRHMQGAVQAQFPGHAFRRASGIDTHHEYLRFAWELVGPDGNVVLAGIDVGEVAEDGRLRRITGFFGDLPAAA